MIPDEDNVIKILKEDTKNKKVIGNSAKSKSSKAMPVPSEKAAAKRHGEIITVSLYDEMLPYPEFIKLPRDERRKAVNAYVDKFTRKGVASFWGKNVQAIHDLIYKLNKDVKTLHPPAKKVSNRMEAAEELMPVIKATEIYPFDLKIIREISGEKIQDYIVKLVDLFEIENDLVVIMDLRRSGAGFFDISIKVDTIMPARQFADELISNIGLLPRNDIFLMSLNVKEKKKEPC